MKNIEKKCQLFLSYSSKDKEISDVVYGKLRLEGFDVWRDQERLETDWSKEIASALAGIDILILLWSKYAKQSNIVKNEWLTARAIGKRIIPYIMPNSPKLPKPLYNLHGITFDEVSKDIEKLIDRFNGNSNFLNVNYDYSILAINSYIPFNPNPIFTGRQEDLVELYFNMIGDINKVGINHVGAIGMGGVGKTQLVVEFAYRFSFAFDKIYWIQAFDHNKWLIQFVELARDRLCLSIKYSNSSEANKLYILKLQQYFKNNTNTLIIMDNVSDPKHLNNNTFLLGLTPLTLGCNILFTTRKYFNLPNVIYQKVKILSSGSSYELLTYNRKPDNPREEQMARSICSSVGCLPLALYIAASYINKYSDVSFADYYNELKQNKLGTIDIEEISHEELATRHESAVKVTLESQWKMLSNEDAKNLFLLSGFFSESFIISKAILDLLSGISFGKSKLNRVFDKSINMLKELNLIEELESNQKAIWLHPLIRDFSRSLLSENSKESLRCFAAINFRKAYNDLLRLENEFLVRGVDEIINDINIVIELFEKDNEKLQELNTLHRLLSSEKSNLRCYQSDGFMPEYFFYQQLHYRAFKLDFHILSIKYYTAIKNIKNLIFKIVGVSSYENSSFVETFNIDKCKIISVSLGKDGKFALVATEKALQLIELDSFNVLRIFKNQKIKKHMLLPDNKRVIIQSSNMCSLSMLNLENGEILKEFAIYSAVSSNPILTFNLSKDVKHCVSMHSGNLFNEYIIIFHDIDSGQIIKKNKFNYNSYGPTYFLGVSEDAHWILQGGLGGLVTILGKENEEYINKGQFMSHKPRGWGRSSSLTSIETGYLTPDARFALTGADDMNVAFYEMDKLNFKHKSLFKEHSERICAASISLNGKKGLTGDESGNLILWDLTNIRPRCLEGHSKKITMLSISQNGKYAITGSLDADVILWDVETMKMIQTLKGEYYRSVNHDSDITDGNISADGSIISSVSSCGRIILWNPHTDKTQRFYCLEPPERFKNILRLSNNNQFVMSFVGRNDFTLWTINGHDYNGETKECSKVFTFEGHTDVVKDVKFSQNGLFALSCSVDKTLILWDIKSCKYLRVFEGHLGPVEVVDFSKNGKFALSGSSDNTMILWDLEFGESVFTFEGHTKKVLSVTFSDDNKRALSCSADKTLILWDIEKCKILNRLAVSHEVTCLKLIGDKVIFGDDSGILHFLKIE